MPISSHNNLKLNDITNPQLIVKLFTRLLIQIANCILGRYVTSYVYVVLTYSELKYPSMKVKSNHIVGNFNHKAYG